MQSGFESNFSLNQVLSAAPCTQAPIADRGADAHGAKMLNDLVHGLIDNVLFGLSLGFLPF